MDLKKDIIPNALNYRVYREDSPKYRFLKIALNGRSSSSIPLTSAQERLEWILPTEVYNLGKSYIQFAEQISAANVAEVDPVVAARRNWQDADVVNIAQHVYYGTSTTALCELEYANNMSKVVRKKETPLQEYLNYDMLESLQPCNTLATANLRSVPITPGANNIYDINVGPHFQSIVSYIEPKYTKKGAAEAGAGQSVYTRYFKVPLSIYKNTVLAVDKDVYFGDQQMFLRLTTPPATSKMGFQSSADADPSANSLNNNGVTLSNVYLFLAVERNPDIVRDIVDLYKKGELKLTIPYTRCVRNATTSQNATLQITVNESYGRKLQKIITTVWNNNEEKNTQYDCQNFDGSKIISYQTFLNSQALQNSVVYCYQPNNANLPGGDTGLNDWAVNKRYCKDSVILNSGVYQLSWFHCDDFTNEDPAENIPRENINDGLDLKAMGQVQWQMQFNTPVASPNVVHYTYFTFLREFQVVPAQGFVWLN